MSHPWSVWLEPCESDRIQLQKLIRDFCARFNSPVFDPHLTLFGRVAKDPVATFPFFENFVKDFGPISLNVLGIKTGEPPWKSLYLQIGKNNELGQVQKEFDCYLNDYRHYEFDPHLSLAYGDLSINGSELDHISFPETITFSSVAFVATPDEITNWKMINQFGLGGGVSP